MQMGSQLVTPEGYASLKANVPYYFVGQRMERVLIAEFRKGKNRSLVIHFLRQSDFEVAIERHWINELPATSHPWINQAQSIGSESYAKRIEIAKARYEKIRPLIAQTEKILHAKNPLSEINKFCKQSKPRQNATRIKLWFFAFLCCGQTERALLPDFSKVGKWDREVETQKRGRPSLSSGKRTGYNRMKEMGDKIIGGFKKYVVQGDTWQKTYSLVLMKEFHCKASEFKDERGAKQPSIRSMTGEPFPSLSQFKFCVNKVLGKDETQIIRTGGVRRSGRKAIPEGKYSEAYSNAGEAIEIDAYFGKEIPKGWSDGKQGPTLVCVTGKCIVSGHIVGIGFDMGAETSRAYSAMLFSMCMDKQQFCELFGMTISSTAWPSQGEVTHIISDRGSTGLTTSRNLELSTYSTFELTPTNAGQSKAGIESSHPRVRKIEGRPTKVLSDLTIVEMAKAEILRVITYNQTADMTERMTPEMIDHGVPPTPNGIYTFLSEKGRCRAIRVATEAAVRKYLPAKICKLDKNGMHLEHFKFNSPELRALLKSGAIGPSMELEVQTYTLILCVAYVWIELQGLVLRVKAQLPMRDDEDMVFISLHDLEKQSITLRVLQSEARETKAAGKLAELQAAEEIHGKITTKKTRTSNPNSRKTRGQTPDAKVLKSRFN